MKTRKTVCNFTDYTAKVGEILLLAHGPFGCAYWRVAERTDIGRVTIEPVESVSFQNADSTFSRRFEAAS